MIWSGIFLNWKTLKPKKRLQEESEKRILLRQEAINERLALEEKERLERLEAPEEQNEEVLREEKQSEASNEEPKT